MITTWKALNLLLTNTIYLKWLPALVKICRLKADDLRGSDKEVAMKFEMYADILNKAHADIDTVN